MALPDPPVTAAPTVTGVDDFALRRGHVYGTVLVDADSGDAIDLLPDREAATLPEWLKAHPGAEVICRDRAGAYAEGARDGAPHAIQVADRWHLWHNLAEHAEKTVARHRGCRRSSPPPQTPAISTRRLRRTGPWPCAAGNGRRPCAPGRYAEIRERPDAGQPEAAIRRATGLDRKTAPRYDRAASADELPAGMTRASKLDDYKPYLCQRWNQGRTDTAQLHAELTAARLPAARRPSAATSTAPAGRAGRTPAPAVPKVRQITSWLLSRPGSLDPGEQARLAAVRAPARTWTPWPRTSGTSPR